MVEDGSLCGRDGGEDFDFGVGVDAFVEPGIFELVGGDHAVPVLVAELVLGCELGDMDWVRIPRTSSAVKRVGYSMPSISEPGSGSMRVMMLVGITARTTDRIVASSVLRMSR